MPQLLEYWDDKHMPPSPAEILNLINLSARSNPETETWKGWLQVLLSGRTLALHAQSPGLDPHCRVGYGYGGRGWGLASKRWLREV